MDFERFCERITHLKLDRASGRVKPYKPLMLIALVVLMSKGKVPDRNVRLDGALKSVFLQLLHRILPEWPYRPDPRDPFRALETDGVWKLVPVEGALELLAMARATQARARDVLKHVACAQLDQAVFDVLASDGNARMRVISLLLSSYGTCLPQHSGNVVIGVMGDATAPLPAESSAHSWPEWLLEERLQQGWRSTPFAGMGVVLATREKHGFPGRQCLTPVSSIDLLGFQPAEKTWWVIELKRGRPSDSVVGQVSRYVGWLQAERGSLKESVKGVIVAPDTNPKLRYSVAANEALSLWTYDENLELRRVG